MANNRIGTKQTIPLRSIEGMKTRSRLTLIENGVVKVDAYLEHDPKKNYQFGGVGMVKQAVVAGKNQKYAVKIFGRQKRGNKSDISHVTEQNARLDSFHDVYLGLIKQTITANSILQRDAFYVERDKKLYLFIPWVDGTTLADLNKEQYTVALLPFEIRYQMAFSLLEQVRLLHSQNYIHGDIKPLNVLWSPDGKIVLSDLDSVRKVGEYANYAFTDCYLDPATRSLLVSDSAGNNTAASKSDVAKRQNIKSDIYALGATLFALFPEMGTIKEVGKTLEKDIYNACKNDHTIPAAYSERAESLRYVLAHMVSDNPTNRPELADVLQSNVAYHEENTNRRDVTLLQSGMTSYNHANYPMALQYFLQISADSDRESLEGLRKLTDCPEEKVATAALEKIESIYRSHSYPISHLFYVQEKLYEKFQSQPEKLEQLIDNLERQASTLLMGNDDKATLKATAKLLYRHYVNLTHLSRENQTESLRKMYTYLYFLLQTNDSAARIDFIAYYCHDRVSMQQVLNNATLLFHETIAKLTFQISALGRMREVVIQLQQFLKKTKVPAAIDPTAPLSEIAYTIETIKSFLSNLVSNCQSHRRHEPRIIPLLEELKRCPDAGIAANAKTVYAINFNPQDTSIETKQFALEAMLLGSTEAMQYLIFDYEVNKKPGKAAVMAFCAKVFGLMPTSDNRIDENLQKSQGYLASPSHGYLLSVLMAFSNHPKLVAVGLTIAAVQEKVHTDNPILLMQIMVNLFKHYCMPFLKTHASEVYHSQQGIQRLEKAIKSILTAREKMMRKELTAIQSSQHNQKKVFNSLLDAGSLHDTVCENAQRITAGLIKQHVTNLSTLGRLSLQAKPAPLPPIEEEKAAEDDSAADQQNSSPPPSPPHGRL